MTAADYRRRVDHLFACIEMGVTNRYRAAVVDRLESAGGQYAPSRTEDRHTRRDDVMVEILRETAEAKSVEACEF